MRLSTPLILRQMGTPPAPENGSRAVYAKDDGRMYTRGNDGVERLVARMEVGPTTPTVEAGQQYVWLQTGLGASGTDTMLWFEDGT